MALWGPIRVNHKEIGYWSAQRIKENALGPWTYKCKVEMDGRVTWEGEIMHKYEDGALVLASLVLNKAVIHGKALP